MPNMLAVWPKLDDNERMWLKWALSEYRKTIPKIISDEEAMFMCVEQARLAVRERFTTWQSYRLSNFNKTGAGKLYKKLLDARRVPV